MTGDHSCVLLAGSYYTCRWRIWYIVLSMTYSRWHQILATCPDVVDTRYDLGALAVKTTIPGYWEFSVPAQTEVSFGRGSISLTLWACHNAVFVSSCIYTSSFSWSHEENDKMFSILRHLCSHLPFHQQFSRTSKTPWYRCGSTAQ